MEAFSINWKSVCHVPFFCQWHLMALMSVEFIEKVQSVTFCRESHRSVKRNLPLPFKVIPGRGSTMEAFPFVSFFQPRMTVKGRGCLYAAVNLPAKLSVVPPSTYAAARPQSAFCLKLLNKMQTISLQFLPSRPKPVVLMEHCLLCTHLWHLE